jgi:hypothetical protein
LIAAKASKESAVSLFRRIYYSLLYSPYKPGYKAIPYSCKEKNKLFLGN